MIGHHVKRISEMKAKENEIYENKSNEVFKYYRDIPLDFCEICGVKQLGTLIRNSKYHDYSVKLYRHHVYPKEIFGRDLEHNAIRSNFCICCGSCHDMIHRLLVKMRKEKGKLTELDYKQVIGIAHKLKRKK